MNDPWDVKSVRQSSQYISCMKLNGTPLLPPVLSKECREEMKKYKYIAQQVEKRIKALKSYIVENDVNSSEPESDATEFPESDQSNDTLSLKTFELNVEKITPVNLSRNMENGYENVKLNVSNMHDSPTLSNVSDSMLSPQAASKLVIDLSFSISDKARNVDGNDICQTPNDVPERDCDCTNNSDKRISDLDTDVTQPVREDKLTFSLSINKESFSDPTPLHFSEDGPTSLGSKSFTGSLNDLHIASIKESQVAPLLRQRSYTVLTPSPMLLAHLKVQSVSRGVDVKSISMSESLSNINCKNKKRRSWDLESAKVKWSSMALELKEKVKEKHLKNIANKSKPVTKSMQSNTPNKPKSLSLDKAKRHIPKLLTKHEPVSKPKKYESPVINSPAQSTKKSPPSQKKVEKDIAKQKLTSESEDPATRVRELYEKIQKQQLVQMANLVEKQKREQMLLQQVFEEQNKLLFTQLKTICPKSPNEVKEAWVEKDVQRGPVSLSQLIDQKSENVCESPVISTLNETNNYINQCDKVLKKSRDMSGSIKKQQPLHNEGRKVVTPKSLTGTLTRTQSPNFRNPQTSRKLVYDASGSSENDYEILTDRTNDTLADLNVTFPSDHSEECPQANNTLANICTNIHVESPHSAPSDATCRESDRAIKSLEDTIYNPTKNTRPAKSKQFACRTPTPRERAAASKIVAYAKGYLVRRLMKTERVQGTVQTIKDTLILALQLHQDGNGIWGADVDLHRRLIQQITAACYTLHDTFVASTPSERCAMIATDRRRKIALANRPPFRHYRPTDVMSQSHSGVFPSRPKRSSPSLMTQSNYESFSGERARRYMQSPRRRPWR